MTKDCNCGRKSRYMHNLPEGKQEMSCNKYTICPTYTELEKNAGELYKDLLEVLKAADDLMSYRGSSNYYKSAVENIARIRKKQLVK